MTRIPAHLIRNTISLIQLVPGLPATGDLLAVAIVEVLRRGGGGARVGHADAPRVVVEELGGLEGGLFLGEGRAAAAAAASSSS